MKELKGPFPGVATMKQMAANIMAPMMGSFSGEITANIGGAPLGAAKLGGVISDVWMSVDDCGNHNTALSGEIDVLINGTTCLTTKPAIASNSGETASAQKTTKVTGDAGILQAVINTSANAVSPGDVISWDLTLTRTGSPPTEIKNPVVVVEFEPSIN